MIKLLSRFLPPDQKALVELAMRMVANLDTPRERREVAEYALGAFHTGRISITDWTRLGKRLGILTSPKARPRKRKIVGVSIPSPMSTIMDKAEV